MCIYIKNSVRSESKIEIFQTNSRIHSIQFIVMDAVSLLKSIERLRLLLHKIHNNWNEISRQTIKSVLHLLFGFRSTANSDGLMVHGSKMNGFREFGIMSIDIVAVDVDVDVAGAH